MYIRAFISVYICKHMCSQIYIYIYMYSYRYIHTHINKFVRVYAYIYVYIHICIHIYINRAMWGAMAVVVVPHEYRRLWSPHNHSTIQQFRVLKHRLGPSLAWTHGDKGMLGEKGGTGVQQQVSSNIHEKIRGRVGYRDDVLGCGVAPRVQGRSLGYGSQSPRKRERCKSPWQRENWCWASQVFHVVQYVAVC